MKKTAIRKAVEKASGKHFKDAIDSVARSKAFDAVYDALRPDDEEKESASEAAAEASFVSAPAPVAHMTPASLLSRSSRK